MKKLAIVGSHPDTRELAPYQDDSYEVWLFNEAPQKPEVYPRWDKSFQMHKPEVYASEHNWVNQDHWNWLQQDHGDKTIWMIERDERVPNSQRYPIEEVRKLVPYKYLRSTPALACRSGQPRTAHSRTRMWWSGTRWVVTTRRGQRTGR